MTFIDLAEVARVSKNHIKHVEVAGVIQGVPLNTSPSEIAYNHYEFTKDASTGVVLIKAALVKFNGLTPQLPQNDCKSGWYAVRGTALTVIRGNFDTTRPWVTLSGDCYCYDNRGLLSINNLGLAHQMGKKKQWKILIAEDEGITQSFLDSLEPELHKYYISVIKGIESVEYSNTSWGNLPPFYWKKMPDINIYDTSKKPQVQDSEEEGIINNKAEDKKVLEENRVEPKAFNNTFLDWTSDCTRAIEKKKDYIGEVVDQYREYDGEDLVVRLAEQLERHWTNQNRPPLGSTGYEILDKYIDNWSRVADKPYLGTTVREYLVGSRRNIGVAVPSLKTGDLPTLTGAANDLYDLAFSDKALLYYGVLGQSLGIPYEEMSQGIKFCYDYNVDPYAVITKNPYLLCLSGALSFKSAEKIAIVFGVVDTKENSELRDIAIVDYSINTSDDNSTVFDEKTIAGVGFEISESEYQNTLKTCTREYRGVSVPRTGSILNDKQSVTASVYFARAQLKPYNVTFAPKGNRSYIHKIGARALKTYITSGCGVALRGEITSSHLLEMELYVSEKMKELGERPTGLRVEDIDEYIKSYESKLNFSLEHGQKQAVHLLTRCGGLVAGCAGSGKSTSTDCFVYVLERLDSSTDIKFAAPTGKAAKRMEEVLHRPCNTIHSLFRLGINGTTQELIDDDSDKSTFQNTVFIIDEGAMISLNIMYKMLQRIDTETCRVYLFGDPQQLPPIGKGFVFRNLLRYMPVQFLTVSKRASDGSAITKASNIIAKYGVNTPVPQGNDFKMIKTNDINGVVAQIVNYYVYNKGSGIIEGNVLPRLNVTVDDIQVMTPYKNRNSRRSWTADQLNEELQPIFEGTSRVDIKIKNMNGGGYNKGTRVIHTSNARMFQQYESCTIQSDGSWVATKKWGYGVMNGEVGKVLGVVPELLVENEPIGQPSDFDEYPDNLRDDSEYDNSFLAVQYSDFVILYRLKGDNVNGYWSDDLNMLDLFYAGSVHKMQGSECKLAICCLGEGNRPDFVNNNMLYTMITRGKQMVFLVGDTNESLQTARKHRATDGKKTIGAEFV